MINVQRAVDWLVQSADERDEGDAVGRALAAVLTGWSQLEPDDGSVTSACTWALEAALTQALTDEAAG